MFNKYRGHPQVKKINRSFDKDILIRKPQPKPPVEEIAEDPPILSSFDDVSETRMRSEAENDSVRQLEEDEWFRRFKGETEERESLASDEPITDETAESTDNIIPEKEQFKKDIELIFENPEEEASQRIEQSEMTVLERSEIEEIKKSECEERKDDPEIDEFTSGESEKQRDEDTKEKVEDEKNSAVYEEQEIEETLDSLDKAKTAEVEMDLTSEEDDENWIQDLLTDTQEKSNSTQTEESEATENTQTVLIAEKDPDEQAYDESEWYQSTPLIRTAALIVLDLTESEEEEENREEFPERELHYPTPVVLSEETEFVPDSNELMDPIDEFSEEESDE